MKEPARISCNVCMDLIPLVQDQVASADSQALVFHHIEGCTACRSVLKGEEAPQPAKPWDQKILRRINRKFFWAGIAALLAAAIFGAAQTFSFGMFYNILIMPLIGGLGSFLFGKRWYLLPAGVFLLTPLFAAVFELFENGWKTAVDQLPATLIFALIYALLVLAGIAIAALFRFAFRKEEKQ